MLSAFVLPRPSWEKYGLLNWQPLTHICDWNLYYSLLPELRAARWSPRARDAGTGEKNPTCSLEALFRHLLGDHVPEGCIKRVEILTDRIVKTNAYPVAYGGFSDVSRCQLRYEQMPPRRVAVKAVRPAFSSEKEFEIKRKAVRHELNVWVGLQHRNILPLLGITFGFGPFAAFVSPWADNGTLSEYLEKFGAQLDLKKRLILLGEIAAGLQYLHSRNIVHGDLSGSNVLISKSGQAWLSDFGLSTVARHVSDTVVSGMSFPGHVRWAAPELLHGYEEDSRTSQLSSPQTDVYSFGMVMLQILTGKLPFYRIQRVAQIVIMVSRGHRPSRELGWDGRDIPDVLWKFIEACWASPSKRPSCEDIVYFISSVKL